MGTLILLRHGESTWNAEHRFTGWVDVPLSVAGRLEAQHAGELLAAGGYRLGAAFTSALRRAADTGRIVLDVLVQAGQAPADLAQVAAWELNERFYGTLTGRDKDAAAAELGRELVHLWRRSYEVRPPGGESLKDNAERTLPYCEREILPAVAGADAVLVTAHGTSLRALVRMLDGLDSDAVSRLEIATGVPIVYELDAGAVVGKRILAAPLR
jgi:2,3-bisphosphoglycerate-dependent phosphoglycerate mutase